MLRKYRVAVSLVVVIATLLGIYQLFWIPYRQSRSLVEPHPLVPDLSSVVPGSSGQTVTVSPSSSAPPTRPVPDGRYEFYLGISDQGFVTIYRWVEGGLVVVREIEQLPVDQLRSEDKAELIAFIGAGSEEEILLKVEGLTH